MNYKNLTIVEIAEQHFCKNTILQMTSYTNLTNKQLRVKVAEALGAKWYRFEVTSVLSFKPLTKGKLITSPFHNDYAFIHKSVPNYPESLDACAEFEKDLHDEQLLIYTDLLAVNCGGSWVNAISAPARQRCIAVLQTKEG